MHGNRSAPFVAALGLLLSALPAAPASAQEAGPKLEAPAEVAGTPRKEIAFDLKASTDAGPPKFALESISVGGRTLPPPPAMRLDPATGAFRWTPTPSQVAEVVLTFSVRDAKDRKATAAVKAVVKEGPVVVAGDPTAKKINQWRAEGTASGNTGEFYDNRCADHSPLDLNRFPQLEKIVYSPEEIKRQAHWALMPGVRGVVTWGNSSTSAGVGNGGCNVRSAYTNARLAAALYEQYRRNNLYVYPAHHDYQTAPYGRQYFGDVIPANTPYVLTSHGSSYSDQTFLHAVVQMSAAFRPEVKRKLVANGLLMPTVQALFRANMKNVKGEEDYLSGRAHPTVFEGHLIDHDRMAEAAHALKEDEIPALVQLKVVEEDQPRPGADFFEAGPGERMFDTPCAVARYVRGTARTRRMVVSAEASADVNKRPLRFAWKLLRGDPALVTIKPLDPAGKTVEITVAHHSRRPVEDVKGLESSRVDIGAFVHNGAHWSAPGFVTFQFPADEARAYGPDGRLLEVGYGTGVTFFEVSDWGKFFDALTGGGPRAGIIRKRLRPGEVAMLEAADKEVRLALTGLELVKAGTDDKEKDEAKRKAAREAREKAEKSLNEALDKPHTCGEGPDGKPASASVRKTVEGLLEGLVADRTLALSPAAAALTGAVEDAGVRRRMEAALRRPAALRLLEKSADGWKLTPITPGDAPPAERLTPYERFLLERLAAEWAEPLLDTWARPRYVANLIDMRLSTAKDWRDVYRHDPAGRVIGWTRLRADGSSQDFSADGGLVLSMDRLRRPVTARPVLYTIARGVDMRNGPAPLQQVAGRGTIVYEYDGDSDLRGRVAYVLGIRSRRSGL